MINFKMLTMMFACFPYSVYINISNDRYPWCFV